MLTNIRRLGGVEVPAELADRFPDAQMHAADLEITRDPAVEMRAIFDAVDEDSDGRITHTELAHFVEKLNLSDCRHFGDHIKAILRSADRNGDGVLEFAEFVELCESLFATCNWPEEERRGHVPEVGEDSEVEQGLLDAFSVFDDDNDGFISPRELQAVMSCFRPEKGLKECSRMIRAVDKDGDGLVNFQEFKEMMMPSSPTGITTTSSMVW